MSPDDRGLVCVVGTPDSYGRGEMFFVTPSSSPGRGLDPIFLGTEFVFRRVKEGSSGLLGLLRFPKTEVK